MVAYNKIVELVEQAHEIVRSQSDDKWYTEEELTAVRQAATLESALLDVRRAVTSPYALSHAYHPQEMPEAYRALDAELDEVKVENNELHGITQALHELVNNPYGSFSGHVDNYWDVMVGGGLKEQGKEARDRWNWHTQDRRTALQGRIDHLERKQGYLTRSGTKARAIREDNGALYNGTQTDALNQYEDAVALIPGLQTTRDRAAEAHANVKGRIEAKMIELREQIKIALEGRDTD